MTLIRLALLVLAATLLCHSLAHALLITGTAKDPQPVIVVNTEVTVPVTGSVSVTNFPITQPVSATTWPLPTNAAQETGGNLASAAGSLADKNASGNITTLNGTVTVNTNGASTVWMNVTGIWSATLAFQTQVGDNIWNQITCVTVLGSPFLQIANNATLICPVGGATQFRVVAFVYASGTVSVTLNAGTGINATQVFNSTAAGLVATATQGPPNTIANRWPVQQTDGTNVMPTMDTATRAGFFKPAGLTSVALVRNDYSSVNVTTAAYTQLVASTSLEINRLMIFDSSGQDFVLATGGAGSEVDQIQIPPGGWDAPVALYIPAGSRISIKAKSATASSGILLITELK